MKVIVQRDLRDTNQCRIYQPTAAPPFVCTMHVDALLCVLAEQGIDYDDFQDLSNWGDAGFEADLTLSLPGPALSS